MPGRYPQRRRMACSEPSSRCGNNTGGCRARRQGRHRIRVGRRGGGGDEVARDRQPQLALQRLVVLGPRGHGRRQAAVERERQRHCVLRRGAAAK